MNWQALDVQPFDPANHRQATQERRRRLFGKSPAVIARVPETPVSEPVNGVQQDAHVRAWEKHRYSVPIGRYSRFVYGRCIELGANYTDIIGPTRHRELIPIRHMLMWELRGHFDPPASFNEIGLVFKRDHTSIIYAVQKWEAKQRAGTS